MHCWQHRYGVTSDVDPGKDLGSLGDSGETGVQDLGFEVAQLKVDVVSIGATPPGRGGRGRGEGGGERGCTYQILHCGPSYLPAYLGTCSQISRSTTKY